MEIALKRVLITGGAGFLGSHLSESFRANGVAVRIFDLAERPDWAGQAHIDYVRGDVRDGAAVEAAIEGVDAVIHAAFASPRAAHDVIESVIVEGARQVCLRATSKRVRRLVMISSTVVQRPRRVHPFLKGAALNSMDKYREFRVEAERIAMEFGGGKLRVGIVRPKTFVGPGRVSAFNIIFNWIRLGKPVILLGAASSRFQLLEIRDMAEGIRLLTGSSAEGIFSFGAREFGSLHDDLKSLVQHAGTGSRLVFIPQALARAGLWAIELVGMVPPSELHYMSAWNKDSILDTSRAVNELGWQPRSSNQDALRIAYDWYVKSMSSTGGAPSIHPLPDSHRRLSSLIETLFR